MAGFKIFVALPLPGVKHRCVAFDDEHRPIEGVAQQVVDGFGTDAVDVRRAARNRPVSERRSADNCPPYTHAQDLRRRPDFTLNIRRPHHSARVRRRCRDPLRCHHLGGMRSRAVPSEHPTYITSNGVFAGDYDCASRMRSVYAPRVIRGGADSVHYRRAAALPSTAYPRAADGGAAARAAQSRQDPQRAAAC